jgi:outer membrane protein OmpA-like peptidoglycan-associated protein
VTSDQIVIHEKIQFATNKATIKPESHGLLDEITSVITSHPQLKRISIEGHTDSTGADARNQQLSEQRAKAVRDYLVQHGVSADRLTAKGWGKTKPIAENATEAGKEQNRRVEFIIVAQDATHAVEVDPSTGTAHEVGTSGTGGAR